jgi:hypothetical protein
MQTKLASPPVRTQKRFIVAELCPRAAPALVDAGLDNDIWQISVTRKRIIL